MSLDLQKMVWEDPEPRGQSKHVLVHLAWYVTKRDWDRGGRLLSWPSQHTIAAKCCIPRSSVQRALADLEALGKIRDTGQRRGRGAIVWELYPSTSPEAKAGYEYAEVTDDGSGDLSWLTEGRSPSGDVTDSRSSESGSPSDLTDLRPDLTDSHAGVTDDGSGTGPTVGHKREGNGNEGEGILGEGRARAGARGSVEGEDLSEELTEVEELLEHRPADKLLNGRREELLAATGVEA